MVGRSKLALVLILFIAGCRVKNEDTLCIQNSWFAQLHCNVEGCINVITTAKSSKPTSIKYTWLVNGYQIYDAKAKKLPSEYFSKHDSIKCVVHAVDNAGIESQPDTIGPLIVKNSQPRVTWADFFPNENVKKGTDISIIYGIDDADKDNVVLNYNWYLNNQLISTDSLLSGDLLETGKELSAEILPYDGEDYGELYLLPRKLSIQNLPPQILGTSNPVISGSIVTCKVDFVDPDGDEVSCHIKQGPRGMTIDAAGNVTWKHPELEKDTIYTIVVQATDANGATSLGRFKIRFSIL